jgi:hypothetical protein
MKMIAPVAITIAYISSFAAVSWLLIDKGCWIVDVVIFLAGSSIKVSLK